MQPKKFNSSYFKMAYYWPLFTYLPDKVSGKLCQISRLLLINEMCSFSEGYALKNIKSYQIQNSRLAAIIDLNICVIFGRLG